MDISSKSGLSLSFLLFPGADIKQFYIYRYENNLNTIRKEKGITQTINLDKKTDDYIKSRIYFLPPENINGFVGKTIKVNEMVFPVLVIVVWENFP